MADVQKKESECGYCTIVTKSYLSYAKVLAESIAEHNPGSRIIVLLADRIDGYFDPEDYPFELITLESLRDRDDIEKMCFYYTPSELCFCLRAWLHEYMFLNTRFRKWMYFDSDMVVYHSLQSISDQLEKASILLSPHLINRNPPSSIDIKAVRRLESYLLRNGGIYNGGFLALRRTEESRAFIKWFKSCLRLYGFDDRPMQSGDQFWLTYAPLYFEEVSVARDPGGNLAYWNLYERNLEQEDSGGIRVNDEPLLFFHFAGFDMNVPNRLTKYAFPPELMAVPGFIKSLSEEYPRLLIESGYEDTKNYPYAFAEFRNGRKITPVMRRFYFEEFFRNQACGGSPFEHYDYFRSRLGSQGLKGFLRAVGNRAMSRMRRWSKPDYHLDVR